jgi:ATP-binding cassette subfamily B protein|tara:strand:+ start:3417 stop:5348 length:1932 start_codon:yes stop_codon:yes gene_type:complete
MPAANEKVKKGIEMFDLAVMANPIRLKREFLATTEVAPQAMPEELQAEFDQIREENPDVLMTGAFWWDFIRTYKKHISLLVLGRAVMTLLVLAAVLVSQRILDETNSVTAAVSLLLFFALVQVVMKIANAWSALLQSQLLVCARTFVTLRVNAKLLRMGQLSSAEFTTGNLKTLISSDVYRIGDFFHAVSRNGIPCLLGLAILGPFIVYYMGMAGLFAMCVGFGAMPLAFILGKYVHQKEDLIKTQEDTLSTIIGEWVTNVRLLRFLGWENLMQTRVAGHVRRLVLEATKQHGVNLINFGVSVTWWLFPIIALIWANNELGENDDLVMLFSSIWMLNHITLYIRWLPEIVIDYASADACIKRLNKLVSHRDINDDLLPDWHQSVASAKPARVHLNNVSYRYEGGDGSWVLRNIFLTLDLDSHVSMIGKVGCGKSTLLKLLCAEIKPTEGTVQVEFDNGVIADLWHKNVYHRVRSSVGYMPQEAYLSNASLGINVALATQEPEADVMRAIRMAELEADLVHWESGLEEEVGETGVNLSGGQKQRVNLARALYSGRAYLLLDDPLSAVDTDTEAALMENLLAGPDGFLLCSHRLSELKQTDRLLVLDDGRLVEDDDPKVLMEDPNSEFTRHLKAGDFAEELNYES